MSVEPVSETIATSGWVASCSPTAASPVTALAAPSGRPASRSSSTIRSVERGVAGAGLTTTALPPASAGPSFQIAITSGKFHGGIAATTPIGRRCSSDV